MGVLGVCVVALAIDELQFGRQLSAGLLSQGERIETEDMLIAATAL